MGSILKGFTQRFMGRYCISVRAPHCSTENREVESKAIIVNKCFYLEWLVNLTNLNPFNLRMSCANVFLFFLSFFLSPLTWADCLSSVCPSVNVCNVFKNHWDNFNQTWHIAFLGEGNSSSFKGWAMSVSKGRTLQNRENILTKF